MYILAWRSERTSEKKKKKALSETIGSDEKPS